MKHKKVLIIDDGDITNIIGKLASNLHQKGIRLDLEKIDLGDHKYKKLVQSDDLNKPNEYLLDFESIKTDILENHMNTKYDLVACDFNFSNDTLNGYEVIKWIKNTAEGNNKRIKKAKFISYTSEEHKLKDHLFRNEDIGKIFRLKLDDFFTRANLADRAASLLIKENKSANISNYLTSELENYSELKFNSVYPKFENKTFSEIAHEIDKETHHGQEFQKTMIDLTVAHMIDLNKD